MGRHARITALIATAFVAPVALIASSQTEGDRYLADIDVAPLDGLFGDRVFVKAYEDGRVSQKIYTPGLGYSYWSRVPSPLGLSDELVAVGVAPMDGLLGPRLFLRGFAHGLIEQNMYTPLEGYTGWRRVPGHLSGCGKPDDCAYLADIGIETYNGAFGPRVFVAGFEDGQVHQTIYDAKNGYSGWNLLPKEQHADSKGGPKDDHLVAVDVEALGPYGGPRLFAKAYAYAGIYQNIYTPLGGYSDWQHLPKPVTLESEYIVDMDVEPLDGLFGPRIFVVAFEYGGIYQNVYTPEDGYSGWWRIPSEELLESDQLVAVGVKALDGLFGDRIYTRAFEHGYIEQNIYTPGLGYSGWYALPSVDE